MLQVIFNHRFVRFVLVGLVNSIFGYGIFAILLYAGLHYSLALLLATILGVLFNFKSTGSLVFGSHDNRLIFRFVGSYVVVYFFNYMGIEALSRLGVIPYIGGAILVLPMAVLAFLINKRFVFNYG
ncbi:MAG: GtrA family protein [Bacteroidota bacterium]